MDAVAFIQRQLAGMWRLSDAILADLTDEQLNWTPPGTVDSIGVVLVHLLADGDYYVRTLLQGEPRLWETAGWGRQLGLATPPVDDQGWDEIRRTPLAVAPALAYTRAVRAATEAYLTDLSAEELDRETAADGGGRLVADVLAALVRHTMLHLGEIAALKGMQGVRGLPF